MSVYMSGIDFLFLLSSSTHKVYLNLMSIQNDQSKLTKSTFNNKFLTKYHYRIVIIKFPKTVKAFFSNIYRCSNLCVGKV